MILDQEGLYQAIDAYEITTRKAVDAARKLVIPRPTCILFSTGALNASSIEELSAMAPKLARGEGKKKHEVSSISTNCKMNARSTRT